MCKFVPYLCGVSDTKDMTIVDHLEELRWHLFKSVVAVLLCSVIVFFFDSFFFEDVLFGPLNNNFPTYNWLCYLGNNWLNSPSLCVNSMNISLQNTEPAGQFMTYIQCVIVLGFVIAFPFIFYQIWQFVKPALHKHELGVAQSLIFWATLLFFLGILFGYFILVPFSIQFLTSFSISHLVKNDINVASYFDLLTSLVLGCGLLFQLPIVVYFLTKIGLLTPQFLSTYRKYSILIILFIAAIITPPDIVSQIIVSLPLYLLYEISIIVSMRIVKTKPNET